MNFVEGVVFNIDKPYGWSSTDVVRKLKNELRRAGYPKIKIGHAGTLDPLATGVLLVCVGKATKRVDELQAQKKEYIATIELGATTPSFDLEHDVDERYEFEHINGELIESILPLFRGEIEQVPPLYSAKRIDGKRAYEYARAGKDVELRTARIIIYDMEVLSYEKPFLKVRVECSKGTYIRSLARDIGVELGSGGHLTELVRSRSGEFLVADSQKVEQVMELISQHNETISV
ncbi:tRNA pseudouridine synthase B [Mucinivorans hirudinis]|uniref:tRNA pseudouridine synthase B n=1 Tax=Mucinivorans hirudinis TaxID=1433126 RepID=A0A060REC6_9BACT|nr:tRNA pseudouridine synthase B [Mucinivorans hirudinis]